MSSCRFLQTVNNFVSATQDLLCASDQNELGEESSISTVKGKMVNLTDIVGDLSKFKFLGLDTYGQNQNIYYLSPFYQTITKKEDNMLIFNMAKNDFLLFEFTLDESWLNEYNLFVFSTYIYKNKGNTIFGTPDSSIFVLPSMRDSNNKIKICCASSKEIAEKYLKLGYLISKLPSDYMNTTTTFNALIRFMSETSNPTTIDINKYITTSYNTDTTLNDTSKYYDSKEIINSYPQVDEPDLTPDANKVIANYKNTITYVSGIFTKQYIGYPYYSNFADPQVTYAIDDAYKSMKLPIPLNINANNTCENYFLSDKLSIQSDSNEYIYILYLNQKSAGAAVTSTIQIYDIKSNAIKNGIIQTGPKLPTMNTSTYPISAQNTLPAQGMYGISMKDIYNENNETDTIVISERISYGLKNYNQLKYSSINSMKIYIGPKLTETQEKTLLNTYKIKVSYPPSTS